MKVHYHIKSPPLDPTWSQMNSVHTPHTHTLTFEYYPPIYACATQGVT